MKKTIAFLLVIVAAFIFVYAEDDQSAHFTVSGRVLTDMSIEELYELEDAVVSALVISFHDNSEKTMSGEVKGTYVVNLKTKKFHYPWCYSALEIGYDRKFFSDVRPSELIELKYKPCGLCKPHINEKTLSVGLFSKMESKKIG